MNLRGKQHRAHSTNTILSTAPNAADYVNLIGWGFDTDVFKSYPPSRNYPLNGTRMMTDLYNRGARHLRLRSRADIYGYSTSTYDSTSMNTYLNALEVVVSDMVNAKLFPIVSWIHAKAESNALPSDGNNYVDWWRRVAVRMRDYDYALAFNLFTEIGDGNLRDAAIYNDWTTRAISAIRATGGRNADRVLILGAPGKDANSLSDIDPAIYEGKTNLVAEWHLYASGPNKQGGQKNWVGDGSPSDRANVDNVMDEAHLFTATKHVPTWIGAWMPYDNIDGSLEQSEVEAFGCYFASAASKRGIPWAMNKLDNFYDIGTYQWIPTATIGRGTNPVTLDMDRVLRSCTECGKKRKMLSISSIIGRRRNHAAIATS